MYQIACEKMQLFNEPMFLSIYEQITHINKVKEYNKLILKKKNNTKIRIKVSISKSNFPSLFYFKIYR